jgi:hypothetical protein
MTIAWPPHSIRPYESLLFLAMRFMRLNRPTPRQFAEAAGISTYDVANLNLTFGRGIRGPIRVDRLRELFGATTEQWSYTTLDWNIAGSATSPCIRVCADCLSIGYHAPFFQLRAMEQCPLHGRTLLEICPNCGWKLPNTLVHSLIDDPFKCIHCSTLQPSLNVLINPPSIEPTSEAAQVAEWFRWAGTLSRVEAHRSHTKMGTDSYGKLWASSEVIGGKAAPPAVQIDRSSLEFTSVSVTWCGIYSADGERAIQKDVWGYDPKREATNLLLYKKYRDHLIKTMPDSAELIPRLDGAEPKPWSHFKDVLVRISPEKKANAFALVLFIYTIEGWGGLGARNSRLHSQIVCDRMTNLFDLKGGDYLAPRCVGEFRCSPAEKDWLRDHFLMEGIRGLFAEAILRAQDMAKAGYYVLADLSRWSAQNYPFAIAHYRHSKGLGFWTIFPSDECEESSTFFQLANVPAGSRLMHSEVTICWSQSFGAAGFPLLSSGAASGSKSEHFAWSIKSSE